MNIKVQRSQSKIYKLLETLPTNITKLCVHISYVSILLGLHAKGLPYGPIDKPDYMHNIYIYGDLLPSFYIIYNNSSLPYPMDIN